MKKNNYDQSSTGTNLYLSCFLNSESARLTFEGCFEIIEHAGYRRTACCFYHMGEAAPEYLSECYNFDKADRRAFRAFVLDQEVSYGYTAKDVIEEKRNKFESWKDYATEILDDIGIYEAMLEGFPKIEGASIKYAVSASSGSCQGEYALILHPTDLKNPDFSNELFGAPVCCVLEVDGEEYRLDEGLQDLYVWDKEQIVEYAEERGLPESVIDWIEENLPEYPEYL